MWTIRVSREAAQMISQLDGSLKSELIEQVDALAQSPSEHLWRAELPAQHDLWMYSYPSRCVEGVWVMLWFDAYKPQDKTMILVALGTRHRPTSF